MGLPGNAAIPAVDARRTCSRSMAGRRIVEMVHEDLRISKILTRAAFENAIRANAAIGGSTNAVIHLLALAGRIGVQARPRRFRPARPRRAPLLEPACRSGKYLMEDFYYAGGLPAVLRELARQASSTRGAHGQRPDHRREHRRAPSAGNREVITAARRAVQGRGRHRRAARQPLPRRRDDQALGGDAAADEAPRPRGRVREHRANSTARIDDPALDIDENCVHGAEELRAQGLSRHGRGRQHAAAAEAAEEGHHRHGAHLRRAHERHRLRHGGAACRARSRGRRPLALVETAT